MKRLKILLILLSTVTLLSSCFLFKPSHKVIEYDEEVKLHDGSMIWVHIKRHYRLAGEPFQKSGYLPSVVEISWDTGFEGVGRKSLVFRNVTSIAKIQDNWYVFGGVIDGKVNIKNYYCDGEGLIVGKQKSGCLLSLNQSGSFLKPEINNLFEMYPNIFYPVQVKNWGEIPYPLNNKKLTWNEKINLQKTQPQGYRFITNQAYKQEQFQ